MKNEFDDRQFDGSLYNERYYNGDIAYDDYMNCKGIVSDLANMIHGVMSPVILDDEPYDIPSHLDIACAYGHLSNRFKNLGWETIGGFDISHYAIERAQELYPNVLFWQGDARDEINYKWKADLVTALCFFEHIPTLDISNILENMRVASKWGFFIFDCKTSPFENLQHSHDSDITHLNSHDKAWWVETLSKYGELHWDAMYEFAKKAEQYDSSLMWGKGCFIIKWSNNKF